MRTAAIVFVILIAWAFLQAWGADYTGDDCEWRGDCTSHVYPQ